MKDNSVILIMLDELIAYHHLPKKLLKKLKGYNAFKKIGVEFTGIKCNRQMCSPSRSSYMTGIINTGIQDNIDQQPQSIYMPALDESFNTIGKVYKNNCFSTGYYGKQHFENKLSTDNQSLPAFCTNTRNAMKSYGFDSYSSMGDPYYSTTMGIMNDQTTLECILPPKSVDYDYYCKKSNNKLTGVLPFLKARKDDKEPFFLMGSFENPHDIQSTWHNLSQQPTQSVIQFSIPFLKEQVEELGIENPFYFNKGDKNAVIDHKNLIYNYFEKTYEEYKNNKNSLPYLESFEKDYVLDSYNNSIFPFLVCASQQYKTSLSMAESQTDLKNWKNLINVYYGLVIESDSYIYKIYKFLKSEKMLDKVSVVICTDHGDLNSAHGLKQKGTHHRESIDLCCLIYSPHLKKNIINTKVDLLGSSIDITSTIFELSKLKYNKNDFCGSSLLKWDKNNKLVINYKERPILQIVNSVLQTSYYAQYESWYSSVSEDIQKKVIYSPTNYFDFQSSFLLTVKNIKINGITKQYKFCRYFSINAVIATNIEKNIKKSDLLVNIGKLSKFKISVDKLIGKLGDTFNYNDTYNAIAQNSGDSEELYIFMLLICYYLQFKTKNYLSLPGYGKSYIETLKNDQYSFYCYNLTDDPYETTNLADIRYPERANIELFELLNTEINNNIKFYKCESFYYLLPYAVLEFSIQLSNKFGYNYATYNQQQLWLYTSAFTNNTIDSNISTSSVRNSLMYFIDN